MYTSFITLSDIDNRRCKTIRINNESSNKIISFDNLKQSIREKNQSNFNDELRNIISEMSTNVDLPDTTFGNLLSVLKEATKTGLKVDSNLFISIIPSYTNINKVSSMISKSNIPITEDLSYTIAKNKTASRILNNYNIIKEELGMEFNPRCNEEYIMSFCEDFDKKFVNMKNSKKFIVCIESLSYIFDKNYVNYLTEDLINIISDYFIFSNDNRKDFKYIYNEMVDNLKVLYNECNGFNTDKNNIYLLESETFADSDDVSQAIKNFKKDTNKSYSILKRIILKLYTKSPAMIIDETPNVLSLIRYLVILGGTGINPLLGLLTLCVDKFIHLSLSREYTEKMSKHFEKEKEKAKKKLDKLDSSSKKYKDAESYVKCVDLCLDKIESYKNSLYTEKELYGSDNNYSNDDYDNSSSDDDMDFNFDESAPINGTPSVTYEEFITIADKYLEKDITLAKELLGTGLLRYSDMQYYIKDTDYDLTEMSSLCKNITAGKEFHICIGECLATSDEDIYQLDNLMETITANMEAFVSYYTYPIDEGWRSVYIKYPAYIILPMEYDEYHENYSMMENDLDMASYIITLENYISELENEYNVFSMDEYLKQNINKIVESSPMNVSDIIVNLGDIVNVKEYANLLKDIRHKNHDSILNTDISCAIGILEDTSDMNLNTLNTLKIQKEAAKITKEIITEKFDLASLKVAKINLANKVKQLGNKEKEVSRNFDLSMTKVKDGLEKAMTNDRREAVIKGSVIPSASKCIKLAITTGAAFLVNPALAIIGCIGGLAISKGLNKRERAVLLDEIEVELKVVEREIQKVESDGDSKKYRQLLLYQNKLRKEAQRIRYHVRAAGYDNKTYGLAKGEDEK